MLSICRVSERADFGFVISSIHDLYDFHLSSLMRSRWSREILPSIPFWSATVRMGAELTAGRTDYPEDNPIFGGSIPRKPLNSFLTH